MFISCVTFTTLLIWIHELSNHITHCVTTISSIPQTGPNDGQSPQPIESRETNQSIALEFGIKEFKLLENIIDNKFANILLKASTELLGEERVPESEPAIEGKVFKSNKRRIEREFEEWVQINGMYWRFWDFNRFNAKT